MPTRSEFDSKRYLEARGVNFPQELQVTSAQELLQQVEQVEYPVACKLGGAHIAHKTERGLVRLHLGSPAELCAAGEELLGLATPEDGEVHLLIAPMVTGTRELILGYSVDPLWGPFVVLGAGGTLTEIAPQVSIMPAPLTRESAAALCEEFDRTGLLGAVRGEAAVDREELISLICALGACADDPSIQSAEMNPVIVSNGHPIPVDALVEDHIPGEQLGTPAKERFTLEQWNALFHPSGVVVAGASTHPGKFGAVAVHHILVGGYEGHVSATQRDGAEVFGVSCYPDLHDLPEGAADLVLVCTPSETVADQLRIAGKKGIRAAVIASAGFREVGEDGATREEELVEVARENGLLMIGPNVQGIVSNPAKLQAQIVGPMAPNGPISVVSQSGNIASTFQNFAVDTGVGIARSVSIGNAADCDALDVIEYLSTDPATAVTLAYIEGFGNPPEFRSRIAAAAQRKPLIIVNGGRSAAGAAAASSHTGSLAEDGRMFDAMSRALGFITAEDPEQAFEIAMVIACTPPPRGNRLAILTTVGGWGVLASDAADSARSLTLAKLSDSTLQELDAVLPSRWSRNNPIDFAGGEQRNTMVDALRILATSGDVDICVVIGIGVQSNQASVHRAGKFADDAGLARMIAYHEQQDLRYVHAVEATMRDHQIPIVIASELPNRLADTPAFSYVRANSLPWTRTAPRAIAALDHAIALRQRGRV